MMLHKLNLAPRLKVADDGTGSFEGYAAVFGNVDQGGDVILRGAFEGAIEKFLTDGFGAVGHDWNGNPINTWDEAKEDDYGLWVKGSYHSTAAAQDARTVTRERLERGKSVGMSIGYDIPDGGMEFRDDGTRILKIINPLFEVSHVTVPMNDLARMTIAKHGLPLADHTDAVLAAVSDLVARSRSLADLRLKEGRVLSGANRSRLDTIAASLTTAASDLRGILKDTEPEKALDVMSLLAAFMAAEARSHGVMVA